MRFLLSSVLMIFLVFPAMGQSAVASLNIMLSEIQSVRIAKQALVGDVSENKDRVESKDIRFLLPLGSEVRKSVLSPVSGQNYSMQIQEEFTPKENNDAGDIAGRYGQQPDDQPVRSEDVPLLLYQIYPR